MTSESRTLAMRRTSKKWYVANKERALARSRAWYHANKESVRSKQIAKKYGLTMEEYRSRKSGSCDICGASMGAVGANGMHVDHDHRTGRVRGILCPACNKGLGCFADDPNRLHKAANYLEESI
jgi:Recombination endonuclease VII